MIKIRYFLWKNKKQIAIWLGLLILLVILVCFTGLTYDNYIIPASQRTDNAPMVDTMGVEDLEEISINKGDVITQTFCGDQYGISELKFKVYSEKYDKNEKITVELREQPGDRLIKRWEKKLSKINSEGIMSLKLKKDIKDGRNKLYSVMVINDNPIDDDIVLYESKQDTYLYGQMFYNGEGQSGDAQFTVVPAKVNNHFVIKYFLCVMTMLLILVVFVWIYINSNVSYKIETVYIICMLIWGIAYLLVMPAFSAPDELAHFVTAYRISNNIIGGVDDTDEDYVMCREVDALKREMTHVTTLETYRYIKNELFSDGDDGNYAIYSKETKVLKHTPLVSHLPQAIGITVSRLLHLSDVALYFVGQTCSFLVYLILVYFAIRIIPVGKQILFALSSMPMMLHIITSFSYDSVICGLSFLLIAYIIKLIYNDNSITVNDCVKVYVISMLLAPCKMVYCFISLLLFLIPTSKFNKKNLSYLFKFGTVLSSVIFAFAYNVSEVSNTSSGTKIIEWADAEGFTISMLLNNIPYTIKIYLRTIHDMLGKYLNTMIGGSLGWLLVDMPLEVIALAIILLVIALREHRKKRMKTIHKIVYVVVFFMICALILTSLLLGWTPHYSFTILGVQGRYFLPVLPLLMLPFTDATIEQEKRAKKWLIMGACTMNYIVVLRIFEVIVVK